MKNIDVGTEFELIMEKDVDIKESDSIVLLPKDSIKPIYLGSGFSHIENLARKIKIIRKNGDIPSISREKQIRIKKHKEFYIFTKVGKMDFENKNKI